MKFITIRNCGEIGSNFQEKTLKKPESWEIFWKNSLSRLCEQRKDGDD